MQQYSSLRCPDIPHMSVYTDPRSPGTPVQPLHSSTPERWRQATQQMRGTGRVEGGGTNQTATAHSPRKHTRTGTHRPRDTARRPCPRDGPRPGCRRTEGMDPGSSSQACDCPFPFSSRGAFGTGEPPSHSKRGLLMIAAV